MQEERPYVCDEVSILFSSSVLIILIVVMGVTCCLVDFSVGSCARLLNS